MFVVGGEQDDPDRDRYTNVSNAVVCGQKKDIANDDNGDYCSDEKAHK